MKRIVVCADGTWNMLNSKTPTNVAKLKRAIAPVDDRGVVQTVIYHPGVGTGPFDRLRGGVFGKGLGAHVREAYRSIVEVYEPGDELFLFGYSRGAFTVRSCGGLIRNSGILTHEHQGKVEQAYSLYRRRDEPSKPKGGDAKAFRAAYSHETRIRFIGVWDTVGALGIPAGLPWLPATIGFINRRWAFHDTQCSSSVDFAYQALAIDERRGPFSPTLWTQPVEQTSPTMEQVWFAGVHSSVGGGSAQSGLSDGAFLWMMEKAEACGLVFDRSYVEDSFKVDRHEAFRDTRTGIYRLIKEHVRTIDGPSEDGTRSFQSVHDSVRERQDRSRDKVPHYAPENLLEYLKRQAGR